MNQIDWNKFGVKEDDSAMTGGVVNMDEVHQKLLLAKGHIYKLHGDMDHNDRKLNYFGFDKVASSDHGALLICTDVASRGLDFKQVEWIVQYDLSSQVKEYVNRVGRTARIASSGSSLCFVMPQEIKYPLHM